jgi:TRAP-type C4-dicarboxylate transport system permease small subunit
MELKIIETLRTINRYVALLVGVGIFACAGFVLLDIITRQIGKSFSGTEEIAGYTHGHRDVLGHVVHAA